MPSTSKKQAKLMAACAHGADYESCPPKDVAKEFNQADAKTGILKKVREAFSLEEMSDETLKSAKQKAVERIMGEIKKGNLRKAAKHGQFASKVDAKIKEEVEQIDEISDELAHKVNNARFDKVMSPNATDEDRKKFKKMNDLSINRTFRKMKNDPEGTNRDMAKGAEENTKRGWTNEEVEMNSTANKQNTTDRYIDHPKKIGVKVLNPDYVAPKKAEYVDHPTKTGVKVRKEEVELEEALDASTCKRCKGAGEVKRAVGLKKELCPNCGGTGIDKSKDTVTSYHPNAKNYQTWLKSMKEDVELEESIYGQHLGTWEHNPSKDYKGTKVSDRKLYKDGDHYVIRADNDQDSVVGVHSSLSRAMNQLKMTHKPKLPGVQKEETELEEMKLYKPKLNRIEVRPNSKADPRNLGLIPSYGEKDDLSKDEHYNKAIADAHARGKEMFGAGKYDLSHVDHRGQFIRAGSVAKVRREMKEEVELEEALGSGLNRKEVAIRKQAGFIKAADFFKQHKDTDKKDLKRILKDRIEKVQDAKERGKLG